MKRAALLLLTGLLLAAPAPALAKEKKPDKTAPAADAKKPAGVTVVPGSGWKRIEIRVDGAIAGIAAPKRADGRRDLAILSRPSAAEKKQDAACPVKPYDENEAVPEADRQTVSYWRSDAPDAVQQLAEPLDRQMVLAAADAEGDAGEEVIALGGGRMLLVRRDGDTLSLVTLVSDRVLGSVIQQGGGIFPDLAVAGGLRRYGRGADGAWGLRGTFQMPVEAKLNGGRLQLSSPGITRVAGSGLLATRPEMIGTERLRTWIIEGDPDAHSLTECWMRLPTPERLIDRHFLLLDGKPMLLVSTMTAEKLSLFGEKALRLFPLHSDRTRSGTKPVFATASEMNIWQPMNPSLRDTDGDGREDLVIVYWKGLKDSTLMCDTYLRSADGSFQTRARSQSFDVEDGDKSFLEIKDDLTGDGVPDALIRSRGKICVHAGVARPSSPGAILSKTPAACADLPGDLVNVTTSMSVSVGSGGTEMEMTGDGAATTLIADFDGDGRKEVVLTFAAIGGNGLVALYRFTTP